MSEELDKAPDFYGDNKLGLQMAYQNAILNFPEPPGGFMGLLADIDVVLTRSIMKYFWRSNRTPEETDHILDKHRDELIEQGKPPLLMTMVPRGGLYTLFKIATQSEALVRTGKGVRGQSIMLQLEKTPAPGTFFTLLIARTADDDTTGAITHMVITPCE